MPRPILVIVFLVLAALEAALAYKLVTGFAASQGPGTMSESTSILVLIACLALYIAAASRTWKALNAIPTRRKP